MLKVSDTVGIILAGGRSSRFGSNKALASLAGTPMIHHVKQVLTNVFEEVVLVTNTAEIYRSLNVPILTDAKPYDGPLGAIASVFQKTDFQKIFVVACDMPILDQESIGQIMKEAEKGYQAVIPIHDEVREYLMAYYSASLLPLMRRDLERGQRSLKKFCYKIPTIAWVPIERDVWFNVNTPADLKSLEERHAH